MEPDDPLKEKNRAFAAVLEELAIKPEGYPSIAKNFIRQAEAGRYAKGDCRPAFLGAYFHMTEQEWDALWALIYG